MPKVGDMLKKAGVSIPPPRPSEPLWKGPCDEGPNGGITYSMLSNFLNCRERFRVKYVLGLRPAPQFNHRIEYGQLWHTCEEWHAQGQNYEGPLKDHAASLCRQYPLSQEQVQHWYEVCKAQFPLYVAHWEKHPDVKGRSPLLQECVFNVPYILPSGRVVRLRGKWDSVDLVQEGKTKSVWLMENKTKGDIDPVQLQRQLSFDLQTMMYLTGMHEKPAPDLPRRGHFLHSGKEYPIAGVRYNVVRRPLSGGKGSIVRHKATKNKPEETREDYYARLSTIIAEEPSHFFMRWNVAVTVTDIERFRKRCLDPLLEQLCAWYDWISYGGMGSRDLFDSEVNQGMHWQHPFGVYNSLDEGGSTDLDGYLETGNETGLVRAGKLFSELSDE